MARRGAFEGPRIVAWAAAGVALVLAATAAASGVDDEGIHVLLRSSARVAGALFLLPFTASALHRLARSRASAWALRNRRYLGLSFAVAHLAHLLVILPYLRTTDEPVEPVTLAGGGLAFLGTALMAATSNDAAQRRLGPYWRTLHVSASWWIWIVFTTTFAGAAGRHVLSGAFAGLMLLGLALRLARRLPARAEASRA